MSEEEIRDVREVFASSTCGDMNSRRPQPVTRSSCELSFDSDALVETPGHDLQDHHGEPQGRDRGVRGDTASSMVQIGTVESPERAPGNPWRRDREGPEDQDPGPTQADDLPAQQGQEEEGTASGVSGGAPVAGEPDRHDVPDGETGHGRDLQEGGASRHGLRGVRQVLRPHIQRGAGRSTVLCGLGCTDCYRVGHRRPKVDPFGQVDPEGSRREDASNQSGEQGVPPPGAHLALGGDQATSPKPGKCGLVYDEYNREGHRDDDEELARGSPGLAGGSQGLEGGQAPQAASSDAFGSVESASARLSKQLSSAGQSGPHRGRRLSIGEARSLEQQSWRVVPGLFQDLCQRDRVVLMEIACEHDSLLSSSVQERTGSSQSASRCGLWNACDLGTADGLRLILNRLRWEQPQNVWMSPPSSPWSPMQNTQHRSEAQKREQELRKQQYMRMYVGCVCVMHECIQSGIHVTLELPASSNVWRLPILVDLQKKWSLFSSVTRGCRVGLRNSKGELMHQGWRVLTTHSRLAQALDLPCRCNNKRAHGRSGGRDVSACAAYTPELTRIISGVMCQELSHSEVLEECQGSSRLPEWFGLGARCTCDELGSRVNGLECGGCSREVLQGEGLESVQGDPKPQATPPQVSQVTFQVDPTTTREAAHQADEQSHVGSATGVQRVEALAQELLRKQDYSWEALEGLTQLIFQLPKGQARRMLRGTEGQSRVFGLYVYGSQHGVTARTGLTPVATKYLNQVLSHRLGPEAVWTSFVLSKNAQTPLHRDLLNHHSFPNHSMGFGSYSGGELWLEAPPEYRGSDALVQEKPDGSRAPGRLLQLRHRVETFSPQAWHGTCPWEGDRYVITAYVSRSVDLQDKDRRQQLKLLGFRVPPPQVVSENAWVNQPSSSSQGSNARARDEVIKRNLYLLHSATGHGSTKYLVSALQKRGASERVLQLAREFRCSVCEEKKRVGARPVATLEPLPPKLSTVEADVGHWAHPGTGEIIQFLLIIDEGSRFRAAKILTRGSKQTPSAASCLEYFQEGWCQYFGQPHVLRLDPSGPFRSHAVEAYCDRHQIYLDIIPGEAHHQIGTCEQAVKGLKEVMTKVCQADPEITPDEAISTAVGTFNQRDMIRGFSPAQHVLGQSPDEHGRFSRPLDGVHPGLLIENPSGEFARSVQRRTEAEKAHAEWNATQRLVRAANSRSRPAYEYRPGELVFFWRAQGDGKSRRSPGNKNGAFLGPARVLATETRRDPEGHVRPGSAVWLIRGRSLIKCSPEQLRHASEREELVESLSEGPDATPWTFTKAAEELGGNQYQDLTSEVPTEAEWRRAQTLEEESPPVRHRLRRKRPAEAAGDDDLEEPATAPTPSSPSRSWPRTSNQNRAHPYQAHANVPGWWEEVHESAWVCEETGFWHDEDAAVEVEIPLPDSQRGRQLMLRDLPTFFTGALKRQAIEVSEKRMTESERQAFKEAKAVEVKNFIAAQAFEALPESMKPSREQAINMRWILTWKTREDGTKKAKARAVLLGYQDPAYEHRATTAPVMTRQTRQLLLQLAANRGWQVQKGDVSGAFLQGREYPGTLYCVPCDEICAEMKIPAGSITKLRRACYGLVDAPLEWYKTIATVLEDLGFERTWTDACAWIWRKDGRTRGMVSGHVDDFLFAGSSDDKEWQAVILKIQERFKWGDWDKDCFVQCGVQVKKVPGGFELSQPHYLDGITEIPVNSTRRSDKTAKTSEREKTQLRALLGGLSWYSQQVAPHVSAEVSLLLSQVNTSTVDTIIKANLLLHHTKARKDHILRIHSFPPQEKLAMYAWVDAANQNRCDGGSTQGAFIALGPESMLQGEMGDISPVAWHSSKIDRACRSPGSSEAQAAVNGEDLLYYARLQWGEINHGFPNVRCPDEVVQRVTGCLVTDSRNVFDKLQTEVMSFRGAEKRTNIELLSLKEAQASTGLHIRWVHSEAQLANALTKEASHAKELEMFYKMGFRWRIVEDPEMKSARKRKTAGLDPLEGDAKGMDSSFRESKKEGGMQVKIT